MKRKKTNDILLFSLCLYLIIHSTGMIKIAHGIIALDNDKQKAIGENTINNQLNFG